MAAPRERALLLAHAERVSALAVLSGGRVASGSFDASIRLWSLATSEELGILEGHTQSVMCLLVLPDGRLASASADRTIRIWDTDALCQVASLVGHKVRVTKLCVLWQGESEWLLASLGDEGAPKLWDVKTGSEIFGICSHEDATVTALAAPFQGRLVTATACGAIAVWDAGMQAATDEVPAPLASLESAHGKKVTSIAVLPSGTVVTGSQDYLVKAWDITRLTAETWVGRGHSAAISHLITLASGRLVSADTKGTVKIWDMPRRLPAATLCVSESAVISLAASPLAPGCLALGLAGDAAVHVWDVGEGVHLEVGSFHGHQAVITALQALPGGRLASGDADGVVRMWDVPTVAAQMHQRFELAAVQGPAAAVEDICAFPGGGIMVAWKDATLKVFDDSLNLVADPPDRLVHTLAVLGGTRMASGGPEDHAVTIWSFDNPHGDADFKLHGHGDQVISLTELPDGNIASGSLDNSIKIWDLEARQCARTLKGHKEDVVALEILRDGLLMSASWDNQIKIWDWQVGRLIVDLCSQNWGTGLHFTAMAAARSDHGGGWIATCRKEKTIRVWTHTEHGREVAERLMDLHDRTGDCRSLQKELADHTFHVADISVSANPPELADMSDSAAIISVEVQVAA